MCAHSPIVGEVRGLGLIIAVEFVADKGSKKAFPAEWGVGAFFGQQAAELGLLVRTIGETIAMSPALIISPAEVQVRAWVRAWAQAQAGMTPRAWPPRGSAIASLMREGKSCPTVLYSAAPEINKYCTSKQSTAEYSTSKNQGGRMPPRILWWTDLSALLPVRGLQELLSKFRKALTLTEEYVASCASLT